mmetsp:Transcript_32222/g.99043  ORF Transcript_32222/g.99043 Transcript_32222/m.99043 type:complete len:221 (+) Transcript_32222:230-892(+)
MGQAAIDRPGKPQQSLGLRVAGLDLADWDGGRMPRCHGWPATIALLAEDASSHAHTDPRPARLQPAHGHQGRRIRRAHGRGEEPQPLTLRRQPARRTAAQPSRHRSSRREARALEQAAGSPAAWPAPRPAAAGPGASGSERHCRGPRQRRGRHRRRHGRRGRSRAAPPAASGERAEAAARRAAPVHRLPVARLGPLQALLLLPPRPLHERLRVRVLPLRA